MVLDYETDGEIEVDMTCYVDNVLKEFKFPLKNGYTTPANENLFKVNEKSPRLSEERAEVFHSTVARALFLSKRARPDIQPTVAFLCTRVKNPTMEDWGKLLRFMSYLKRTKEEVLTLRTDGTNRIRWWIDAAFAVHPDMRSHTGAVMSLGSGAIQSISKKQKVNTRSSTEAELVAVDDVLAQVIWTQNFLRAQGFEVTDNVVYQDNKSTMLLEKNGRASAGKRSRHLDIRYFFITDHIKKGEIDVKFCPTDAMTADYMSKSLHGKKFLKFKKEIMNMMI